MDNISVGDLVKVECIDAASMLPNADLKKIIGHVVSIFNAFDKSGDNWTIEIRSGTQWFLYKPKIDGGTISILEKSK